MKKYLLNMILALGAVLLVGCGGGGGGSSSTASLVYEGKTEKAVLTEENTKYFLDLLNNFAQAIDTPSYLKSQKIAVAYKSNYKLGTKSATTYKVIDSGSTDGAISGRLTVIVEETGTYTGNITYTYENYSDYEGLIYNGKIVNYLTVNNQEIITKSVMEYQLFNVKANSDDVTIDGSMTASEVQSGTKIIENFVAKNNKTDEMLEYEDYETLLNTQGKVVSFRGKVYNSNYGYVDVSTLVPLAYNNDGSRKAEGELLIDAESSSTTIKYAYDNRIRVEIDTDKDGTVDAVQVYREGNYEDELPNEAPVISITFPQSIYTDTDMSAVQVTVYDPDLDGFMTEYEWTVNGTVKGSQVALDNTLFKKHDMLKLTVSATDDRVGDIKSSTEVKEQVVLNSAPVVILDLNTTEIEVGQSILLDASKSFDVDGDSFTFDWFTQNRSYNATEDTYNLGNTHLDINDSSKSKILFIGEKVNYISYAAPTEIQPYGVNLKLNDGDTAGISEVNSTNIIVRAMDLFVKELTILESQGIVGATAGDINSDGLLDIIVVTAHPSDKEIVVFLQNEVKSFSPAYTIPLGELAPISYASLSISDVNNDEIEDIVLTLQSYGEDGFSVYYQDANNLGSFSKEQYIPKPVQEIIEEEPSVSDVNYHVVEDMNNDGKNDVLTVGYSNSFGGVGNNIEMFFQTEDGLDNNKTWTVESIDNEFPISSLSLIDADGDSYLDLISRNHILYQELDGTYMHKWYDGLEYITYADLDNDDNNELIGVNGFDNELFVYSNNDLEKRHYVEVKSKNIFGDGADQIFVSDLNGDQKKDIIVGHSGLRFFTVFIEKENEYLENQMYWVSSGDAIHSLGSTIVKDMNNDGKEDVIMIGQDRFEVFYTK